MASEIQVSWQMAVRKVDSAGLLLVNEQHSGSFQADMAGNIGASPGGIEVPIGGVIVDLSRLGEPGWCVMANLGRTDGAATGLEYVDVCIYDADFARSYPLLELSPGQSFPVQLSRNLFEEFSGTGTSTPGTNNRLLLRAFGTAQSISIKAYKR